MAALGLSAVLIASCSSSDAEAGQDGAATAEPTSVAAATPRLAVSHDGGILVLDAESLEVVGSAESEGFVRLNPAGDGRHVFVSTGSGFTALDTGTWTDGTSHYTAEPALTDITFSAETPGHVVRHAGKTVLFDDGTGLVRIFDSSDLSEGEPDVTEYTTPEPHHGVAVELSDGSLLTTIGDEEERTGIVVLDRDRNEIARNEDCPGVHGEAVAADEAVVVGCQTGVLVYRDGTITKIASPDPYGRIGNQAGDEESPVLLGDYKSDPDADLERPERVALVDTRTGRLDLVDLGTSYTFRSLGRGPHGEALVLGTDGRLHVIDVDTKQVTNSIDVIDPWTEPEKWQEPRPALFVEDHTAYVTDPATNSVHAVDIEGGTVTASVELPETPNEITGVTG
ncbi:hypothetical protein G4H71_00135 [Rhodococcus triatomae]|uniref:Secreted protein n=1 Tax=Rhodococcus triatomae TaxID=300028 RepID=A0A1G8CIB2_9NOCA|nr:zinc metallochaperone AztD [Rhodococcus triatomae]QNG21295.1 hypothetical protein G4H72_07915 [Rhodococcus triatomae]QNG25418.1 hypothetical protein G4H71_00135 [Rhodococcus triatomae]SDH44953.1 hypothetical protein SAMN05444695_10227 [Rhodococcus triatomae]